MMKFVLLCSVLQLVLASGQEEDSPRREWKNADASASFMGDFVAVDGELVEILKEGDRSFKIPLTRLHQEDRDWIESHLQKEADRRGEDQIAEMGVFDTLRFGDQRAVVLEKLQKSTLLTSNDDGLFGGGKTGLDGKFRTKKTLGDAKCVLFFEFKDGGLSELSLRTEERPEARYQTSIKKSWAEMVELFEILYGKPSHHSKFPFLTDVLRHGSVAATHKWKLENGGEAILGPAVNDSRQLYVYIRISAPKLDS